MGEDLEKLKQRFSLLDYLRQQNWVARPAGHGSEFVGLCPLHRDTRPSFYVNARKNLFYCHGCGQGGDLLRFIQLSRQLSFRQSLAYGWEQVQQCPEVILVEGLFDYAVLWQAGFRHVTCSLGTHLNTYQFQQRCDRPRTIYLTFDVDANGSGQQASQQLADRLRARGISTRRVLLTDGHDPNSFFVQGGDARQFQSLLEAAQP
jgi:DNA primase